MNQFPCASDNPNNTNKNNFDFAMLFASKVGITICSDRGDKLIIVVIDTGCKLVTRFCLHSYPVLSGFL